MVIGKIVFYRAKIREVLENQKSYMPLLNFFTEKNAEGVAAWTFSKKMPKRYLPFPFMEYFCAAFQILRQLKGRVCIYKTPCIDN